MNRASFTAVAASLLAGSAAAQPCQPYWNRVEPPPGFLSLAPRNFVVHADGAGPALYTGGASGIFRWTGAGWQPFSNAGAPPGGMAAPFGPLDDGSGLRMFGAAASAPMAYRWIGDHWDPCAPAFAQEGISLHVSYDDGHGSRIYALRPSMTPLAILRWDGAEWTTIGRPDSNPECLAVYDSGAGPSLYVGGSFSAINGAPFRHIARWNGQSWSAVGAGLTYDPVGMAVFDDGTGPRLCTLAGERGPEGFPVICMWDGESWTHPIGGGWAPPFHLFSLQCITAFDDGTGPGLVVAGTQSYMVNPGGVVVPANLIARWNGKTWTSLGAGVGTSGVERVGEVAPFTDARGPSLFVSGVFEAFGGGRMGPIAQWFGCPNCYADGNADQRLDVNDVVYFLQKYAARNPYANCTVDATMDAADFVCFMNKFAAGCER